MTNACPNCKTEALEEAQVEGFPVTVDHCAACDGIWFDRGKLDELLRVPESMICVPANAALGQRRCPRCNVAMHEFFYPRTFVSVVMCRRCHGLWLDHNEFQEVDAVREFLARTNANRSDEEAPADRETIKEWLLDFVETNINAYKFWGR